MRILMVNTEYSRGGAARMAERLHMSLNTRPGVTCPFVYGRGRMADAPNSLYLGYKLEVYIHALIARLTGLEGYGSWLSTRRFIRYVRKEKFDLMHLHNLHGYYLNLSFVQFLKEAKLPVVWTLHDGWPLTGRCTYPSDCEKWRDGCGNCPDMSCYPRSWLLDSSALLCTIKKRLFSEGWSPTIVTPSRWLAQKAKESYLGRFRIESIPNGVDTDVFRPKDKSAAKSRLGLPLGRKIVLLMAANLNERKKGMRYFFEALRQVKDSGLTVLLVGKEMEIDGEMIKKYDIRQMGFMSKRDLIVEAYNAADVFCVTYLNDNFPTTVLESMSCGTPVVGFDSGGVSEQVTEGCGILGPPQDTEAIGKALNRLLKDEALRTAYSRVAREKAVDEYSLEKHTTNYLELYKELLNSRERKI
jgi:putative colanic acid biosynthesis glycosyltransferase